MRGRRSSPTCAVTWRSRRKKSSVRFSAILAYDTVDEAVEIANDTVYGLGAHVQGTDMERSATSPREIRAGQVHLNDPDWDPNAPFGGYKRSGNGREYGLEGMEEYLETKAVLGFYP